MGIYAYRFAPVHYTDMDGMEAWLEDMAAKGFVLGQEGIYFGLTAFEKTTPKRCKYRLIASTHKYAKGRGFWASYAPPPDDDTREFHREFGWEYVATRKDFHIYCAEDPDAPEMDTDPRIQATVIHTASKRKLRDFLCVILGIAILIFYGAWVYFRFQLGGTGIYHRSYILCFFTMAAFFGIHSLYSCIRLKKLEKRLLSGEYLSHRSDYCRNRVLYWLGRSIEPLCCILILVLVFNAGYSYHTYDNAIPLDSYTGTIPFATLNEVLSGMELREDSTWEQTIEVRKSAVADTTILFQHQHITLPNGEETSGYLDVTYSEVCFEWIANHAYQNNLRSAKGRDNQIVELNIDGADQAFAFQSIYYDYVAIRKGNIIMTAKLYLYDGLPYSPEEFALIMAQSLK